MYVRDDKSFKESLGRRRDEIVLRTLEKMTPALAAEMLESARMHLLIGTMTTGDLDGVVLLAHCEMAIKMEHSQEPL